MRFAVTALLAVLAISSSASEADAQQAAQPTVREYIDAAVDTLRRVSRHANDVNWSVLRDSAYKLSEGAQQPRDVYPVVDWLLSRVDKHSFLQANWNGVRGAIIRERFAYVRVPFFSGGMVPTLADSLQNIIRRQDVSSTCGWIVDLRNNGGGNMWPMLAGIGPLLGDTIVGWNQSAAGRSLWKYRDGASVLVHEDGRNEELVRATVPPHALRDANAPIAVLIDAGTGSSGEVMAVSFKGRQNTRFFGSPTAGVSTTNNGYRLPDGVNMVITIGVYVDRTNRMYGQAIEPDEVVKTPLRGPTVLTGDPVIARATSWLAMQQQCR